MKTEVKSSNITSIDYDEKEQILTVEFIGGGCYKYDKVPVKIYKDFMNTESKGKFFHSHIKSAYTYKKIDKDRKCAECLYNTENFCDLFNRITENGNSCDMSAPKKLR